MNDFDLLQLRTEPELRRLVQPLSKKSLDRLKISLLSDPSFRHVDAWNGFYLNSYETGDLCMELDLPCQIIQYHFSSLETAASFVCSSQLNRTDLSNEYRKYLIGKKHYYEECAASVLQSGNKKPNRSMNASDISQRLHLSPGTILKYRSFSDAIDIIFEHDETFAYELLSGKIKVSHENTIELSRLTGEELHGLAHAVKEDGVTHLTFQDIRHEVKWRYIKTEAPVSRKERNEQKERIKAGIRQMPAYNPDSEVNSLCMTVNSWISSIERVHNNVNYSSITEQAAQNLQSQLSALESSIYNVQSGLLERKSS